MKWLAMLLAACLIACTTIHPSRIVPDFEFVHEGCYYICFRQGSEWIGIHKGNCPNSIHRVLLPDWIFQQVTTDTTTTDSLHTK